MYVGTMTIVTNTKKVSQRQGLFIFFLQKPILQNLDTNKWHRKYEKYKYFLF